MLYRLGDEVSHVFFIKKGVVRLLKAWGEGRSAQRSNEVESHLARKAQLNCNYLFNSPVEVPVLQVGEGMLFGDEEVFLEQDCRGMKAECLSHSATLNVLDNPRDPNLTWEMIGPLWSVLPTLATGLTQVDGRGFYDGSELVIPLA